MKHLKSQNLVSGFRVCGIFPLDRHEILKRLPSANATDDVNEFSFNQSVLEILKTNCFITGERKRKQTKRGKKIIPGKCILNASESKEENDENVPCSSSGKKMQQKKGGAKKSEVIDDTDDEDIYGGGVENTTTNGMTIVQIVGLFVTFAVNIFTSNVPV